MTMTTLAEAPRVYFDTALLCDMADGKHPPEVFAEVCRVLAAAEAIVVFGPGHMADLHRRAEAETRDRVFGVLDRLPRTAAIHSSPPMSGGDHQRLNSFLAENSDTVPAHPAVEGPDVELRESKGDFKAFLHAEGYQADGWIEAALECEALSVYGSGYEPTEEPALSRDQRKLLEDTFAMATRGEDPVSALLDRMVPPGKRNHPLVLAEEARQRALEKEFEPWLPLLGEAATKYGGTPERLARNLKPENHGIPVWWRGVPNGVERWLSAARALAPGLYLKARLVADKNRDKRRQPKLSDSADENHVSLIPYMDVFTLDRENLAIVGRHLSKVRPLRRAILVANGDLSSLVDAIRSLSDGQ